MQPFSVFQLIILILWLAAQASAQASAQALVQPPSQPQQEAVVTDNDTALHGSDSRQNVHRKPCVGINGNQFKGAVCKAGYEDACLRKLTGRQPPSQETESTAVISRFF